MSNLKKIIIIILLVVIILIMMILGIMCLNKGEVVYQIDETGSEEELFNIDSTLKEVTVRNDFYAVKTCVQKFYGYYISIFKDEDDIYDVDIEEITQKSGIEKEEYLYKLFDKDYIQYKNLTLTNIKEHLNKINDSIVNINNMYVSKKTPNISIYIVQGRLREVMTGNTSDFELMLKIDALNKTFSVFLEDYINDKYSDLKLDGEIDIEASSIEKNTINMYDYSIIDDETYALDLFLKYKEEILFDKETAYNHLQEEYRNKRFGNFENFETFAKENIISNVKMEVSKYQKNVYEDYTEYVCIDQNGKYYIFNEKSVMNYELILDTYTVNLPDFIKKYDKSDEQTQVGMNIEKIITAINTGDYNYVYNKLDETFRNNNFSEFNNFVQFIQNNFYEDNNVSYKQFENLGGVYTYTIEISNSDNSGETKNLTLIMKLLENREFIISFGLN